MPSYKDREILLTPPAHKTNTFSHNTLLKLLKAVPETFLCPSEKNFFFEFHKWLEWTLEKVLPGILEIAKENCKLLM